MTLVATDSPTLSAAEHERAMSEYGRRALTTGDSIPNPIHDQIGFCKK